MARYRRPLLLFFVPAGVYVAVMVLLAVFALHPSRLGWIGLGVMSSIAFGLAGVATAAFARMRVNADRTHPHEGAVHRLLLVVDADVPPWRLLAGVQPHVSGRPHEVFVVAPTTRSLRGFLTEGDTASHEAAQRRLDGALRGLGQIGITVDGCLGEDDPLQAIGDALAFFPADEIVVVDGNAAGRWLDRDLARKARDLFGVHASDLHREVVA